MADEAIIVELLGANHNGEPIRYTCADATGIAKGSVMELTTPRTVVQSTNVDRPIVGIAAAEKVANDGETSIAVLTNCIVQLKCATTQCEFGEYVSANATDNNITLASTLDSEKGWAVGKALETIAVGATGLVRVLK